MYFIKYLINKDETSLLPLKKKKKKKIFLVGIQYMKKLNLIIGNKGNSLTILNLRKLDSILS